MPPRSADLQPPITSLQPLWTRTFVLAWIAHFLHALSYNLHLHLPGFLHDKGANEFDIGVLFGVASAIAIGFRPVLGWSMDTHGRRPAIVAGGALATLVCSLYLTVSAFGPWVYVIRIGHGIAEATLFASLFAFAADIVPATRRIEGIAIFGVSGVIPGALGGLLGDVILAGGSYGQLFATSAGCALLALALSIGLKSEKVVNEHPSRGFAAAVMQRDLLPLWLIGLVFAMAVATNYAFMKTFVQTTGIGSVGAFFTAYSIAAASIRILSGSLPERVGPKRVLFPALVCMAVGLSMLAGATNQVAVIIAGLFCGVGHGYTFPILTGMVVHRARASERGAAMSIFTALFDAGALIGGPLFGALIHRSGYPMMYAVAALMVIVGAAVFGVWDRGQVEKNNGQSN